MRMYGKGDIDHSANVALTNYGKSTSEMPHRDVESCGESCIEGMHPSVLQFTSQVIIRLDWFLIITCAANSHLEWVVYAGASKCR